MVISEAVAGYFGTWWAPAVSILLLSMLMKLSSTQGSWIGALSLFLVFTLMALFMLGKDDTGLIRKTGELLGGLSPTMMVIATGIIGGITGLVSGWLGSSLALMMATKK